MEKAKGGRAPFVVLDRGDAPVAVAGGFGIGAPAAVVALEMCVAPGAQRIVVVGYAGACSRVLNPVTCCCAITRSVTKALPTIAHGVLAVEMELAAVYAAAQVLGVASAGICVMSDSLSELTWRPHFRDPQARKQLRAVFDTTVAMLAGSAAEPLVIQ